jgi:DNA replication and repair protein RecF
MHVSHLSLRNFRNYGELELPLHAGTTLFYGPNAAGKTTLLEAVYFLATTRSPRTSADREMINWDSTADYGLPPFARLATALHRRTLSSKEERVTIELVIQRKQDSNGVALPTTQKSIKINKTARRALDLVGQLRVVLFTPLDIDLLTGPPADRRRWLDVMLSQLDGRYVRALADYNKVLQQRNALLRTWREGRRPRPDEARRQLQFWNTQLTANGAYIVAERQRAVVDLAKLAADIHRDIAGVAQQLEIVYNATVEGPPNRTVLQQNFEQRLEQGLRDELDRGQTLTGPHRDDAACRLDGVDIGVYGSRGQQRSLALALKLGEAELMRDRSSDAPILLLDDILSELDAARRAHLLQFIDRPHQQTLMTAADLADFDPSFLAQIERVRIEHGKVL